MRRAPRRGRWANGGRRSAASRVAAQRSTCATSASTSTSPRCSTSAGRAARSPKPTAPSARRRRRSRRARSHSPKRSQAGGVAATGKHFPGFGSARVNTDFAVQRLGISKARLRRVDEAPYRPYIAAGGDLVMLSTAIYPAFSGRPAAFTRSIATGELRGRLGFDGVAITDALESVAVRAFGGAAKAGSCRRRRRRRPPPLRRPRRGARRSAGAQPRPRLARALADGIRTIGQPRPSPPAPTALNLRLACHLTARRDSSP